MASKITEETKISLINRVYFVELFYTDGELKKQVFVPIAYNNNDDKFIDLRTQKIYPVIVSDKENGYNWGARQIKIMENANLVADYNLKDAKVSGVYSHDRLANQIMFYREDLIKQGKLSVAFNREALKLLKKEESDLFTLKEILAISDYAENLTFKYNKEKYIKKQKETERIQKERKEQKERDRVFEF